MSLGQPKATFSKLDDGKWGVRIEPANDGLTGVTVTIQRKDQTQTSETLGELVKSDQWKSVYRVAYKPGGNGNGNVPAPQAATQAAPQQGNGSPTHDETLAALRYLASRCNYASTWDGAGFNKFDAGFGHELAERTRITINQERAALKLLNKYRVQLEAGGINIRDMIARFGEFIGAGGAQTTPSSPAMAIDVEGDEFVIHSPYSPALVEAVRLVPDRRWDSARKVNLVPVERCLEVEKFGQANGFVFTQAALKAIEDQRALAEIERQRVEALIEASQAKDADIDLPVDGLHPFQKAGVQYALERRRTFIADEMGLGKTVQALTTLEAADTFPALIICPKSVVPSWRQEANRWLPKRSVQVVDSVNRAGEADITIIHYDALAKRIEILTHGYAALVLDESHFVKNRKAKRTEIVKFIVSKLEGEDPIVLCLSGTPLVNRPAELITQLQILRRLEDLGGFRNYWHRFCAGDQRGAQNLNELNVQLRASCMVRRLKKDVLTELPPRTFADVPTDMDNLAEYRYAEDQFLAWVRESGGDPVRASRAETLARLTALRGLVAKGKMAAGIEWCRDFLEADGKLVIFAHHKPVQDAILAALADFNPVTIRSEDNIDTREQSVRSFQEDDSVRAIVCSLMAGSIGITLTAASNVAFFELAWTPKDMLQAADRCHRIGQRDAVTAWQLVAPGTIDDFMAELLEEKRQIMEEVLDGRASGDSDESMLAELVSRMAGRLS